jgi:nicotinamide-nucleotide amidase
MLPDDVLQQAEAVITLYRARARKIALAESCTGGLVSAALTHCAGASDVFERGYVTYSNEGKMEILGVPQKIIRTHGAVSEECAVFMAKGAQRIARADIGLSVTGIAGPGGGSEKKPIGLVFIGLADQRNAEAQKFNFKGGRQDIRHQAVAQALAWLLERGKKF